MGDFPLMTDKGTFIINGAERVIVSQLVRSPGPYYDVKVDKSGSNLYSTTVIPNRGAWLEYETDSNDIVSVRIDRTRKLPVTVLVRALGLVSDQEIINFFGEDERLLKSLDKDNTTTKAEALIEIYKKLRPGEPPTVESATSLINSLFFDDKRYDLAKVGRYKFNKKLGLLNRIEKEVLAEDVVHPETGEIIAEAGIKVERELAMDIENAGVKSVIVLGDDDKPVKVIGNHFVDFDKYVQIEGLPRIDRAYYPVLKEILDTYTEEADIKAAVEERYKELNPKNIIPDDILASISYILGLPHRIGNVDDIDHLGNRRIRSVGELLQTSSV